MMETRGEGESRGWCERLGHGKLGGAAAGALGMLTVFLFVLTVSEVRSWPFIGGATPVQTTINVSGKGEIVAKPDIATFSFGVTEEGLVIAEVQKKAADEINALLDYLKKNGVADKDLKTTGYNIYPRYDYVTDMTDAPNYRPGGKQVLAAYVVSQTVEVKVRKIEDAGKLIGSLGELGATNISGLSFSVDKQDEIMKEARALAIADAEANAKRLAADLGVRLARIVSYSENGPMPIYFAKSAAMGMGGGMAESAAAPSVPSGENKITSNVTITYEIR